MISCSPKKIRHLELVNEESSQWQQSKGLMYRNGTLFSGQSFKLYPSGEDTMYIKEYIEGKRNDFMWVVVCLREGSEWIKSNGAWAGCRVDRRSAMCRISDGAVV